MADGHNTSGTSFDLAGLIGEVLAPPPASIYASAADALAKLAAEPNISEGFRRALRREIAELEHQAREAGRYRGVAPAGLGPDPREPASVGALAAEGERIDRDLAAYRASPAGKARLAISKACRIAELNNLTAPYAALDAVGAALSRGDGSAVKAVERAQDAICKLPHGDVRDALALLATELKLLVGECA